MTSEDRRVPDVLLEQYLARVLEGETLARVETCLARSAPDRLRLEQLRAQSAEFLRLHPPSPRVERSEREARGRRLRWGGMALAFPVLAGLAVMIVLKTSPVGPPPASRSTAKGGGVLLWVSRRAPTGYTLLEEGDTIAQGDTLQLKVRLIEPGFLAVIGSDAQGRVVSYVPSDGHEAVAWAKGDTQLPESRLELPPGDVEIFAIYSSSPFEVMNALEAFRSHERPPGLWAYSRQLHIRNSP